jgi:hypothetical protein
MDQEKVKKLLYFYTHEKVMADDQHAFYQGICHIQLGNYIEGKKQFYRTAESMFSLPMIWKISGQPFWIIDFCVLSGRIDLFPFVHQELEDYKKHPYMGDSNGALFAYGILELLYPTGWEMTKSIQALKKRPKWKLIYAWGSALEAIFNKNSLELNIALQDLLKSHEGMAKHGSLRYSAEGLLCLSAMSLVYTAIQHQIPVEIENDYFSMDYLKFIMKET